MLLRPIDVPAAKTARPMVAADYVMPAGLAAAFASCRRLWIEAPGGFGKTQAVAAWLAQAGLPAAWITCDAGDNDPVAFAQAVAAALAAALGDGRLRVDGAGGEGTDWAALGRYLAARLDGGGRAIALVVDDVHLLAPDAAAGAMLSALVTQAPDSCRVVLIGRSRPGCLPIERWLAVGRARALGPGELRLDARAAARLWAGRGRPVSSAGARRLVDATGGWPLAVAMLDPAALGSPTGPGGLAGTDVTATDGSAGGRAAPRTLFAFLAREVLDRYTPRERRFLLAASFPDELAPWLAQALDPDRGDALYARLVRPPWFTRLEGSDGAMRGHALLRAFLREEAAVRWGPGARRRIHRRLVDAYLAHDREEEAMAHLLRAGHVDGAAALACRLAPRLLRAGRWATVDAWLAALEARGGGGRPEALVARAHLIAARDDHAAAMGLAVRALARGRAAGRVEVLVHALAFLVADIQAPVDARARRLAAALADHGDAGVAAWAGVWRLRIALLDGAPVDAAAVRRAAAQVRAVRPDDALSAVAEGYADHILYLAGHVDAITCTPAQLVAAVANRRFAYWPALLYAGRWRELDALVRDASAEQAPSWAAGFVRAALDLPRAALLALGGEPARALELLAHFDRDLLAAQVAVPAHTLEWSVYRALRSQCLARVGDAQGARLLAWENLPALGTSALLEAVGQLDLGFVLLAAGDIGAGARALAAAGAVAGDPGLRGLYHRILSAALQASRGEGRLPVRRLARLLREVEAKGAYGMVAAYDPGQLRPALEAADAAALAPRLRPARDQVLTLMREADRPAGDGASPSAGRPVQLRLESFGGAAVRPPGAVVPRPGRRAEELFWRLVWAGDGGLSRERAAEAMWPDTALAVQQNRLRVTLYALRRWLDGWKASAWLELRAGRLDIVLVRPPAVVWDVETWSTARGHSLAALDRRQGDAALAALAAGLVVRGGPLLPEPHLHDAFVHERERLAAELADLLARVAALVGAGHRRLIEAMQRASAAHPDDPDLALLLVRGHLAARDDADARLAYGRLERIYREVLDQAPPPFESLADAPT